jgi:hypothetical protein
MALGEIATAFGPPLLKGIAGIFGSGERREKRQRKKISFAELQRLSKLIEAGPDRGAILGTAPMMTQAMMPFINQAFGRGAARFGSRSGAAAGAGLSAVNQAVSVPIAQQLARVPFEKFRGLQHLAGIRGSLAG